MTGFRGYRYFDGVAKAASQVSGLPPEYDEAQTSIDRQWLRIFVRLLERNPEHARAWLDTQPEGWARTVQRGRPTGIGSPAAEAEARRIFETKTAGAEPCVDALVTQAAASQVTLYRAAPEGGDSFHGTSSWSPDLSTAEAYLDNPGFGGAQLYTTQVDASAAYDARDWEDVARLVADADPAVGDSDSGDDGAEAFLGALLEALEARGFEWSEDLVNGGSTEHAVIGVERLKEVLADVVEETELDDVVARLLSPEGLDVLSDLIVDQGFADIARPSASGQDIILFRGVEHV
jgi:ClpP class serine protease